jgi:hypothetical protein
MNVRLDYRDSGNTYSEHFSNFKTKVLGAPLTLCNKRFPQPSTAKIQLRVTNNLY